MLAKDTPSSAISAANKKVQQIRQGKEQQPAQKSRRGSYCHKTTKLTMQVRAYLVALRAHGAVVNTAIPIGCAEGIMKSKDNNLLASNGGHISVTKHWGKHPLTRMGLSSVERALMQRLQCQTLKK